MTEGRSDIFDALKADHDKHRDLLARIDEASGDPESFRALFSEFAIEAKAHAAAEEQSLYATMMGKPSLTEESRHSVAEHKEIEDLVNALADASMESDDWLSKFRFLKKRYLHHIEEEEEEVFPAAEKRLTDEDEVRLRKIFETRKPKEKAAATAGEDA